jgi:hypothetical protein
MYRRQFSSALPLIALLPLAGPAAAAGLGSITEAEAGKGLQGALETGAVTAVKVLGRPDGFLENPQVHIPLPDALKKAERILAALGQSQQLQDLEVAINRAAENAVPLAKNLLLDAVRHMTIGDAKRILTGGETSVTEFFEGRTRAPLSESFLPVVRQVTSKIGLAQKYDRIARKAQGFGLMKGEDASIDHYVTRKALDGLYLVIGDEEKKIRRDPVGTGSALLAKVFGALR